MKIDLIEHLNENITEVRNLMDIHVSYTGKKRGRRAASVDVLNKSCVVLLVACWEVFIEDLSIVAFDKMLKKTAEYDVFPNRVLSRAVKELKESKNDMDVWQLAGSGWKDILINNKKTILEKYIGDFNNPNPNNVENLFEDLLGLKQISAHWGWRRMTPKKAKTKLKSLIRLRGDIAHKVKATKTVGKSFVLDSIDFVYYLAVETNNAVVEYVMKRLKIKEEPWPSARYKGIN